MRTNDEYNIHMQDTDQNNPEEIPSPPTPEEVKELPVHDPEPLTESESIPATQIEPSEEWEKE